MEKLKYICSIIILIFGFSFSYGQNDENYAPIEEKEPIELKGINSNDKQTDLNIKEFRQKNKNLSSSGMLNMLKSSINQSDNKWASTGMRKYFDENLQKSLIFTF